MDTTLRTDPDATASAHPTGSGPHPRPPRKRHRVRNTVAAGGLVIALAAGSMGFWALDRFVIDHVQVADVSAYEASLAQSSGTAAGAAQSGAQDDSATATVTADSYASDGTAIEISTVVTGSGSGTVTSSVADVRLGDATLLRSAFAEDSFGTNIVEDTSAIAAANDAVFAINGATRSRGTSRGPPSASSTTTTSSSWSSTAAARATARASR